jgi:hypothetical protein
LELFFDRLLPASSVVFPVYRGYLNPQVRFNRKELEIILAVFEPSFWVLSFEYGEIDLRKFACRAPATTAMEPRLP